MQGSFCGDYYPDLSAYSPEVFDDYISPEFTGFVVSPVIADVEDKPLFMKSKMSAYAIANVKQYDGGVVWLNYKK